MSGKEQQCMLARAAMSNLLRTQTTQGKPANLAPELVVSGHVYVVDTGLVVEGKLGGLLVGFSRMGSML